MTKRIFLAEGLSTPAHVHLRAGDHGPARLAEVLAQLGLPLIVKPPREGSSIGVSKVSRAEDLPAAVALAARYDPDVLCEAFIDGEEVTCPVLGAGESAHALPVIRIVPPEAGYDYKNKYFTDEVRYLCPSGLPAAEEREIQRLALGAYRALGCRGWGRADLMVRRSDRKVFLLEMNTSPGMTGHSLVPMSAREAGMSYEALCSHLLSQAALDA